MKFVEIFGKDIKPDVKCPYCLNAIEFCQNNGLPFVYRDIANDFNRGTLLARLPDAKTVPQIFIGENHIGGFGDLEVFPVKFLQQMVGE